MGGQTGTAMSDSGTAAPYERCADEQHTGERAGDDTGPGRRRADGADDAAVSARSITNAAGRHSPGRFRVYGAAPVVSRAVSISRIGTPSRIG